MTRVCSTRLFSLAILAAFSACSNGGGDAVGTINAGGDFIVLGSEPADNGQLFLNDSIRIDFSTPIDITSVNLNTISFQVFDQIGKPVGEPVAGEFIVSTSPGDATAGRRLEFVPVLPTNNLYTNGGFRPGRTYQMQLVGGNRINGTVIRDVNGRALSIPRTLTFSTAEGTTPGELFRNTAPGGPRRVGFDISPTPDTSGVVLNKLGTAPVELRLSFDQPLNPSTTNVPTAVDTDPVTREDSNRGRVYLEYDDPDQEQKWIPASAELEVNAISGSTLLLRPIGVLPNNATIRVVMQENLEDISGESNTSNPAFDPIFATFQTRAAYDAQFDGLVDNFLTSENVDVTAAFSEPVAEVGPGFIKAGFAFEGQGSGADFVPQQPLTILNTEFTSVTPATGQPFNVQGGIFEFNNVNIPANRVVRGEGSNPMVWLVTGRFEVSGTLSVDGGNGERVFSSGNANIAKAGGAGRCGGGDGGDGSPSNAQRDKNGGTGNGPLQGAGTGGRGGELACLAGCGRGAGGGGGSLSTQGDPHYKIKIAQPGTVILNPNPQLLNTFPIFQQQTGAGGQGCLGDAGEVTRYLTGALAGDKAFSDARNDNDFWGVGVRYDTNLRITGELSVPVGGGGGGGGGDLSYNSSSISGCDEDEPNFQNDSSGGGGGGGGGVLVVKALGPIIVHPDGLISANGGNGGGGEPSASSARGGGGGGGAGGMVVLMSADSIQIWTHGGQNLSQVTYADNNYDFAISADGGVCVTDVQAPVVEGKYPADGVAMTEADRDSYDSAPLGGFGGMGIVQLMAPPGDYAADSPLATDGTNTRLDDNIHIFDSNAAMNPLLTGADKQRIIAWQGFLGFDDLGNPVNPMNLDNEGDIRPAPLLLPAPFAKRSRVRSKWIDTGATVRRPLAGNDGLPRGVIEVASEGVLANPRYEWAGVITDANGTGSESALGYVDYQLSGTRAIGVYPVVVQPANIISRNAVSTHLGQPAYRVQIASSAFGTTDDRFVQYEAELLAGGNETVLGSYRILAHSDNELVLSPESGPLNEAASRVRIVAKFFGLRTDGVAGLGPTYVDSTGKRIPIANVRIGFAFHQDPGDPGKDRFPEEPGTFVYDLSDPDVQEAVRDLGAAFIKWDILFDTAFKLRAADMPPTLSPDTQRPELRFLRVPFRF